eukprot:SAG31_NODE_39565_length_287_cov_0.824468_1_plen_56_part_00
MQVTRAISFEADSSLAAQCYVARSLEIVDAVKIPADLARGDYVLQWRLVLCPLDP